jgi:transcriptional regulator with XRE-family HTH domain
MKQTWQIRFKKKCIDMGMTSGEAAEKMGVSRSYLSEVLTGVPGNADEVKEGDASSRWAIPIAS